MLSGCIGQNSLERWWWWSVVWKIWFLSPFFFSVSLITYCKFWVRLHGGWRISRNRVGCGKSSVVVPIVTDGNEWRVRHGGGMDFWNGGGGRLDRKLVEIGIKNNIFCSRRHPHVFGSLGPVVDFLSWYSHMDHPGLGQGVNDISCWMKCGWWIFWVWGLWWSATLRYHGYF